MDAGATVIKVLAQLFRGIHYVVGFSAPSEDTSDHVFVLAWLGVIVFVMVFVGILLYYSVALVNSKP
jgi:nucleoside permease NupC